MTPRSKKIVRQKLLFQNCIVGDTDEAAQRLKGKAKIRKMGISRSHGVHRKQLLKGIQAVKFGKFYFVICCIYFYLPFHIPNDKNVFSLTRVRLFMERDDNSTCLPGKKDANRGDKHQQKRILNDYIYNLHRKVLAKNSDTKLSLTTFRRMRHKHISIVKFSNRKTCLYEKIVKGIESIREEKIKFSEWKRVDIEKKGKFFKRMQIVSGEKSKSDFVALLRSELTEFRKHIHRVKEQYGQSRHLKDILPTTHAICHMDFAENYTFGMLSAYIDKNAVTLHPVEIYTKDKEDEVKVKHKSQVVISDELSHTSSTVFAIMKHVVKEVKAVLQNVEMVHYMTDSPTSQHRNMEIFSIVAHHDTIFPGIKASWLYFEAGHGKGPCDGVRGTAQRLVDMAVKRHSAIIQSADDFFQWGKTKENSALKYIFVPKSQCTEAQEELLNLVRRQVKGTIQVHAVIPFEEGSIAVRNTSCFCDKCFVDGQPVPACDGWTVHQMSKTNKVQNSEAEQTTEHDESE
ncbi:hypothetical protein ACJMK2_020596 [Sinanodonta woodiana]|uniref:Uncharacterized protein n=1 Tax=Sinanodonta woodiana TaxID=1069815 RepID=A0ABD3U1V6_SINWO